MSRVGKAIQPAQRIRVRRGDTVIEQHGYHQRQAFMSGIQMTLHRRNGIAHQPEGHMGIRRALVLNNDVNIALAGGGF